MRSHGLRSLDRLLIILVPSVESPAALTVRRARNVTGFWPLRTCTTGLAKEGWGARSLSPTLGLVAPRGRAVHTCELNAV